MISKVVCGYDKPDNDSEGDEAPNPVFPKRRLLTRVPRLPSLPPPFPIRSLQQRQPRLRNILQWVINDSPAPQAQVVIPPIWNRASVDYLLTFPPSERVSAEELLVTKLMSTFKNTDQYCHCGKPVRSPIRPHYSSICTRCWKEGTCGGNSCTKRLLIKHEACKLHPWMITVLGPNWIDIPLSRLDIQPDMETLLKAYADFEYSLLDKRRC